MENLAQGYSLNHSELCSGGSWLFLRRDSVHRPAFAANATVFQRGPMGCCGESCPSGIPVAWLCSPEGDSFSYPDYLVIVTRPAPSSRAAVAAHFPLIPASIGGQGRARAGLGPVRERQLFAMPRCAHGAGPSHSFLTMTRRSRSRVVLSSGSVRRRFAADPNILTATSRSTGNTTPWWEWRRQGFFYGVDHRHSSPSFLGAPRCLGRNHAPTFTFGWQAVINQRNNQWLMLDASSKPESPAPRPLSLSTSVKKRLDDTCGKTTRNPREAHPASSGRPHCRPPPRRRSRSWLFS